MAEVRLIIHDIRSTYNAGSLLRTADCLGVAHTYITGYTPYPAVPGDERLPHEIDKTMRQLHKTALGAEKNDSISRSESITSLLDQLKSEGFRLVALEQAGNSIELESYKPPAKVALLLGREVEGIDPELLDRADDIIEIAMKGRKESLNVVQAAAIALYGLVSD
jgi:23S rRNA (guanosine2251-2'-O)-methyltransferase